MDKAKVTRADDNIHLTLDSHTVVIPIHSGFRYEAGEGLDGEIVVDGQNYPCSNKQYKRIIKHYHRLLKPQRKPHLVWAGAVVSSFFIISLSILTLGLNTGRPLTPAVSESSFSTAPSLERIDGEKSPLKTPPPNVEFPFSNS